jgi:hypothetical protein
MSCAEIRSDYGEPSLNTDSQREEPTALPLFGRLSKLARKRTAQRSPKRSDVNLKLHDRSGFRARNARIVRSSHPDN